MTIILRILHAPSWFLAQIIFVIAFFQVDNHIYDICGAGDDDDDAGEFEIVEIRRWWCRWSKEVCHLITIAPALPSDKHHTANALRECTSHIADHVFNADADADEICKDEKDNKMINYDHDLIVMWMND